MVHFFSFVAKKTDFRLIRWTAECPLCWPVLQQSRVDHCCHVQSYTRHNPAANDTLPLDHFPSPTRWGLPTTSSIGLGQLLCVFSVLLPKLSGALGVVASGGVSKVVLDWISPCLLVAEYSNTTYAMCGMVVLIEVRRVV